MASHGAGADPGVLSQFSCRGLRKNGKGRTGTGGCSRSILVSRKHDERITEAELYRLKGELVLQSGVRSSESENPSPQPLTPSTQAEAEAEVCFLKAIDIAQHQQAKSWELRASTSLARLWQSQGKQKEAHKLLAEIYN